MKRILIIIVVFFLCLRISFSQTCSCTPLIIEKSSSASITFTITLADEDDTGLKYYNFVQAERTQTILLDISIPSAENSNTTTSTINTGNYTYLTTHWRVTYLDWNNDEHQPAWAYSNKIYVGTKPSITTSVTNGNDVKINWSSTFGSVESYNIYINGEYHSNTFSTTTTITGISGRQCTVEIAAEYPDGNELRSDMKTVALDPVPPINVEEIYYTNHTSDVIFPAKAQKVIKLVTGFQFTAATPSHLMTTELCGACPTRKSSIVSNENDDNKDPIVGRKQKNVSSILVSKLSLYPNPINGILNIDINNAMQYAYTILSVNGNIVEKRENNAGSSSVNFSDKPAGIYFIVIQVENGEVLRKKIIKM